MINTNDKIIIGATLAAMVVLIYKTRKIAASSEPTIIEKIIKPYAPEPVAVEKLSWAERLVNQQKNIRAYTVGQLGLPVAI